MISKKLKGSLGFVAFCWVALISSPIGWGVLCWKRDRHLNWSCFVLNLFVMSSLASYYFVYFIMLCLIWFIPSKVRTPCFRIRICEKAMWTIANGVNFWSGSSEDVQKKGGGCVNACSVWWWIWEQRCNLIWCRMVTDRDPDTSRKPGTLALFFLSHSFINSLPHHLRFIERK